MKRDKPPVGSTTQVPGARFRPHGRVDMWMEDDVLQYEATGPFNVEVVDCLAITQRDYLLSLTIEGPWASIGILRNSAMMTPEGLQRYTELMQSAKPEHLEPVATAFVLGPEIEGGRIMRPHFERIYALIQRPFRIVDTMEEAQQWVRSMVQAHRRDGGGPGGSP